MDQFNRISDMLSDTSATASEEAEAQVLGCILLEPELIDEAATALKAADFYALKNQNIFELLLALRQDGKPLAAQTVLVEAKSRDGDYDLVGGPAYVSSLPDQVPSSTMLPYSISVVQQKSRLRALQRTANTVLHLVGEKGRGDDERIEEASALLASLLNDAGVGGESSMRDVVREAVTQLEHASEHKGECTGIPTGFLALDKLTAGFHAGDMIVLAARPSIGKTSLALNIAEHAALDKGIPVGFLSLEMTDVSLVKRIMSSRSNVNGHKFLDGNLTERDIKGITVVAAKLAKAPLIINDKPGLNVLEMASIARRMVLKHGCKLLILDYLQLMHAKAESRVQEVTQISCALKSIAKELNVPVLVLSQLNRSVESRDGGIPRLSDLRDSGAVEQDADLVMFLSRDTDATLTRLDIAKHRSGPTGIVELDWDAAHTKYKNPEYWMKNDAQSDPS
jgi:replicative DNA helicase